ncbi:MAG: EVE domain-containing protein [Sphaerobacter sp.]|nr:EVE domain-containing protein [Sphaerobacter sp.]
MSNMRADRTYWLNLFSPRTWQEFRAAGGAVSGFRETRWRTVQRIRPGDYLLCYLTQASRFVGVLEVTSEPYHDDSPIWAEEVFPCRVSVRPLITLDPEFGVPIHNLRGSLSIFQVNPNAWSGHVRGSPTRWKPEDGEAVVRALEAAQANPVEWPVPRTGRRQPRAIPVGNDAFTVPGPEAGAAPAAAQERSDHEATAHDEIQWLLLKLGNDMGLDVWVARNDRGKVVNGRHFADLPRLRKELPRQFDEVTNRTIELIDVLWLRHDAIVAAFEIESTTSIYSGLLRMSDLLAMQPNLHIQLFLVAPDERRDKVISEVNRPTFSRRTPPLRDVCRFISFSTLRAEVAKVGPYVSFLKPDFIESLAEACVADEGE